MGHGHAQEHARPATVSSAHRGRLAAAFAITAAYLVVEVVGAMFTGSLALLADAGHMFTDAAGLGLALVAIWFAGRAPTMRRTFGWYRAEILAAVANAVVLLGLAGYILLEAWQRLREPAAVSSGPMLVIAVVGLVANAASLKLLSAGQAESLNLRGAYLEVLGDLLGSAATVIAAVVIALSGFTTADSIASLAIGVLIVPRTIRLLRDAVDVLLEATPRGVDLETVRDHITEIPGVVSVHDLHAWTITSGMNVLSAHVVVRDEQRVDQGQVLDALGDCLAGHFDIEHSTFQLEGPEHRHHEGAACP